MMIKLFILLLLSNLAFAQKAKMTIIDPDIDGKELQDEFEVSRPSAPANSLPDKGERDILLSKVKEAAKWDELKKDIFFMDLKSKSVSDLRKKYPELSGKELSSLKKQR